MNLSQELDKIASILGLEKVGRKHIRYTRWENDTDIGMFEVDETKKVKAILKLIHKACIEARREGNIEVLKHIVDQEYEVKTESKNVGYLKGIDDGIGCVKWFAQQRLSSLKKEKK